LRRHVGKADGTTPRPIVSSSATCQLLVPGDSPRRNVKVFGPVSFLDGFGEFLGWYLNNRHRYGFNIGAEGLDVVLLHFLGNIAFGGVVAAGMQGDSNV